MMSDGFRAMLEAIKLYRTHKPMNREEPIYKDIIDYNEVDCRVVWEIVNYLRANH
jgi:predicted RecB family nuclease